MTLVDVDWIHDLSHTAECRLIQADVMRQGFDKSTSQRRRESNKRHPNGGLPNRDGYL